MTTKEQQTIDNLYSLVKELRNENTKFREDIKLQVDTINTKTEKKHLPIYLEQDILKTAQEAINESIIKSLTTGYNSPMGKLVEQVINENSIELKNLISDSFVKVIRKDEFKESILNAFSHKVAKTIISNNDSMFEKVCNELKQDTIFKSKMALAVANVVNECLIKQ